MQLQTSSNVFPLCFGSFGEVILFFGDNSARFRVIVESDFWSDNPIWIWNEVCIVIYCDWAPNLQSLGWTLTQSHIPYMQKY